MVRTIMIFPEFENMEIIGKIREKYDPLARLVRPHITLVFPFESEMDNTEIERVLNERLEGIRPFEIELQGFSKVEDRFGNYLFLDVIKGREELIRIHDLLYANDFKKYDIGVGYVPHMTVGKLKSVEAMDAAYKDIEMILETFKTLVTRVSVEMIGENEESIIVVEKIL